MPKGHLNWLNLQKNKCPQCGRDLQIFLSDRIECMCSFRISTKRMQEILADMYLKDHEKEETKQADNFLEGYGF